MGQRSREPGHDVIEVGDAVIAVTIDDPTTRKRFAVSFASLTTERPPTATAHIRADSDRHVLAIGGVDTHRSLDPTNVLDHLVAWTNREAVLSRTKLVNLHAAGVVDPVTGRVVVVPGGPGAGKTTTAAAACAAGWGYLGDELISIGADGLAVGYPKPLTIKPGTLPLVDVDQKRWTTSPRQRRWYLPVPDLGGHVAWSGVPHAVVCTRFDADTPSGSIALSVAEATLELATNCQDDLDPEGETLVALARLAASAHTIALTQSEPDDGVRAMEALVNRAPAHRGPVGVVAPVATAGARRGPTAAADTIAVTAPDGTVVHKRASGALVLLDPLAGLVWQLLDGSATEARLAAELADEFGHRVDVVEQDLAALLTDLREQDLIED